MHPYQGFSAAHSGIERCAKKLQFSILSIVGIFALARTPPDSMCDAQTLNFDWQINYVGVGAAPHLLPACIGF